MKKVYYPVMLNISGKKAAVIGGGEVASRKVGDLLEAGADVIVIAPEISRGIEKIARESSGSLTLRQRPYERGDLEGMSLVFSATDDPAVNRNVFIEAEERGIFINAVDDPDNCSFIVPSMIRRGDLVVAVSTSGTSPSMAAKIRRDIEKSLPGGIEKTLSQLRRVREILMYDAEFSHLSSNDRGKILKQITDDSGLLDLIETADDAASLKKALREII